METTSFDLHVLGTPPAYILSQDQTLIKKFMAYAGFLSLIFKVVSQTLKTDYPSKTEILIKEFSGLFCFLIVKDLLISILLNPLLNQCEYRDHFVAVSYEAAWV